MRRFAVMALITGLLGAVPAGAGPPAEFARATGFHVFADAFGDPSPDATSEVLENQVTFDIPIDGGPFTGVGHIVYRHTISNEFCERGVYITRIDVFYSGTYDPDDNGMMRGVVTISVGPTSQAPNCPDFGFTYNGPTEPEYPFEAQLDRRNGHVTEFEGIYAADAFADPAVFADTVPPTVSVTMPFVDHEVGVPVVGGAITTTPEVSQMTLTFPPRGGVVVGSGTLTVHNFADLGDTTCEWRVERLLQLVGLFDGVAGLSGTYVIEENVEILPGCGVDDVVSELVLPELLVWDGTLDLGTGMITGGGGFVPDFLGEFLPPVIDEPPPGAQIVEFTWDLSDDLSTFDDLGLPGRVVDNSGTLFVLDGLVASGFGTTTIEAGDDVDAVSVTSFFEFTDDQVFEDTITVADIRFADNGIEVTSQPPHSPLIDLDEGTGVITAEDGSQTTILFDPVAGPTVEPSTTTTTLPGQDANDPFAPGGGSETDEGGGGTNVFLIISAVIAAIGAGAWWLAKEKRKRDGTVTDTPDHGSEWASHVFDLLAPTADGGDLDREDRSEIVEELEGLRGDVDLLDIPKAAKDDIRDLLDDAIEEVEEGDDADDELREALKRVEYANEPDWARPRDEPFAPPPPEAAPPPAEPFDPFSPDGEPLLGGDSGTSRTEPAEPAPEVPPVESPPVVSAPTSENEKKPRICGPDVTEPYLKALNRLADRIEQARAESWSLMLPGSGIDFLRANGPHMDFWVKWDPDSPCGSCPGCGPYEGRYLCMGFNGKCYPVHYFSDTIFGLTVGLLGVSDSIASIGARYAEYRQNQSAFTAGEAISQRMYPVAAEIGRQFMEKRFDIKAAMVETVFGASGQPVSDCTPCLDVDAESRIFKDFTAMNWDTFFTTFEKPKRRRKK